MKVEGYEFQTEWLRDAVAQGRQEGRQEGLQEAARMLVRALLKKGFALSPVQLARIESCVDPKQLESWLDRAMTASSAADLFDA